MSIRYLINPLYDSLFMERSYLVYVDLEEIITEEAKLHPGTFTSYRQTGTLFEGGRIVDFVYMFAKPHKLKSIVKIDGETIFTEGYTGEKAWEMHNYIIGEPAIALENISQWPNPIVSLQEFRNNGNDIKFINEVQDHDERMFQLRLQLLNGTTRDYFLDTETLLPLYMEEKRKLQPGAKPKGIETVYDDYRMVDGVNFPFHIMDRVKGEEEALVDIQWIHVTPNPEIDINEFDRLNYDK